MQGTSPNLFKIGLNSVTGKALDAGMVTQDQLEVLVND